MTLTAAHVGISKWNWESVKVGEETLAKRIMGLNKFDILPVRGKGDIRHYYQTKRWGNYDKIDFKQVKPSDCIYYRLSFYDLLQQMSRDQRLFYFLSNANEVLGLVSLVNFNNIAVYNYLYQIIADLEVTVAMITKKFLEPKEVLDILSKSNDEQARLLVDKFKSMEDTGIDNNIYEFLYLSSYAVLLKAIEPNAPGKFKALFNRRKKFAANGLYTTIRNRIAHPTRDLFKSLENVADVNELFSDYYDLKALLSKA